MVDCVFEDRDALLPRLAVDGTNPFFPKYVLSFVDRGIVVDLCVHLPIRQAFRSILYLNFGSEYIIH